ncbi:MAG: hypothetical protein ACP5K1_06365, partial [Candidatus Bathyarchaeia archaeon]
MPMSLLNTFKLDKNLKRFAVDSIAHTIFYGVLGAIVALALGIELKVYLAMSIIGSAVQIVSGG